MTFPVSYIARVLSTAREALGHTDAAISAAAASLDMPLEAVARAARDADHAAALKKMDAEVCS